MNPSERVSTDPPLMSSYVKEPKRYGGENLPMCRESQRMLESRITKETKNIEFQCSRRRSSESRWSVCLWTQSHDLQIDFHYVMVERGVNWLNVGVERWLEQFMIKGDSALPRISFFHCSIWRPDLYQIFTSKFWKEFIRMVGTQIKFKSTYHPHTMARTRSQTIVWKLILLLNRN
jgi:hypothetical protein